MNYYYSSEAIAHENLNIKGLAKTRLSKYINDAFGGTILIYFNCQSCYRLRSMTIGKLLC
ncbi:MAG: hypothetical protein F6K39_39890 [Okeania sp. SIO3B3]|nr:hypothetical protein [Okeania sp. SIO3B3]